MTLKSPFPYFGGKRRVSTLIWERFGNVPTYIEPFAGSLAVLLGRPQIGAREIVNDLDCYIANFWRAVKYAPNEVAEWADWPTCEADLTARQLWLVQYKPMRVQGDPHYYDSKIAGWWLWGLCNWIGASWCSGEGAWRSENGILSNLESKIELKGSNRLVRAGISRRLPKFAGFPGGINRQVEGEQSRFEFIFNMIDELAVRMRDVRVGNGDWTRVCSPGVIEPALAGIFLDPPYTTEANRCKTIYANESLNVGHDVCKWAIANGDNPNMRIAVCGYEGEYQFPASWDCVHWKAAGGYGVKGGLRGYMNSYKERIWFSPHCIKEGVEVAPTKPQRAKRVTLKGSKYLSR